VNKGLHDKQTSVHDIDHENSDDRVRSRCLS
jgi:hypothetical protein